MRHLNQPTSRRGSALTLVMVFVLVMGITIGSLSAMAVHERRQSARMRIYQDEMTAAEQAIDAMIGQIKFFATNKPRQVGGEIENFHNAVLGIQPPSVPGFTLTNAGVNCIAGGDLDFELVTDTSDPWYGYTLLRVDYRLTCQAVSNSNTADRFEHPGVALERVVRLQQIPLWAYAIFYDNTLELDAGQRIDVVGRVHTNGDFYLTTSSEAYYHKQVTVAGDFYAGIYEPTTGRGTTNSDNIYVTTDGAGNFARVQGTDASASEWLDSRVDTWVAESMNRFNGNLRDRSHGISQIGLPIPETDDPHSLIERPDAGDNPAVADIKFANQADISIYGDLSNPSSITAYDSSGNVIPLQYVDPDTGHIESVVSTSRIYNGREEKYVDILDLDMGKLIDSGINVGDGVIYVSPDQPTGGTSQAAVRLNNAESVPTNVNGSLTIATDGPLYTRGDVNTSSDAILMVACDAVNVLSENFDDSLYQTNSQSESPQNAVPTTTNMVALTGNVPSADNPGAYSGGAENYFRYLERWGSSNPHTFNGSMLNLFESEVATGPWDQNATPGSQSSPYYSPPRRIWSWDSALAGVTPPAGMPTFLQVNLLEWKLGNPI